MKFASRGPWDNEPDNVDLEICGFSAFVNRHPRAGHLCGYLVLPVSHPWASMSYDDIESQPHGGWTFAERGDGSYTIGFDCAHAGDIRPGDLSPGMVFRRCDVYRDLGFVIAELVRMARAAKEGVEEIEV